MRISRDIREIGQTHIVAVLFLVAVAGALAACAAAGSGARITNSREATEIWHSYQILPNYHYYFWGPGSQPYYLVGIDDKYQLVSNQWKPVDLTPAMLKNWFNYIDPRVGFSPFPWGSFIIGPNGERIGLWYSVRDWRRVGSAHLAEDNQVTLTTPSVTNPRQNLLFYPHGDEPFEP